MYVFANIPLTEEITLEIYLDLRSNHFLVRSFKWRGLHVQTRRIVRKFRDSRENVFDMYGDSRENLLEILAVVIILSPISSVCGK